MRPPVPATLEKVASPSGVTSAKGKPRFAIPGNVLAAGVGEIAAAQLARAFEQMANRGAACEAIDVIGRPPELVHERRNEQRGIGNATGDHDIGAARERGHQRLRAQIGIGRHERRVVRERKSAFHRRRVEIEHVQHVVAGHRGHFDRDPEAFRDGDDRIGRGERIGRAEIARRGGCGGARESAAATRCARRDANRSRSPGRAGAAAGQEQSYARPGTRGPDSRAPRAPRDGPARRGDRRRSPRRRPTSTFRACARTYSGSMPAFLMMAFHFSDSATWNFPSSAGVVMKGSVPVDA